MRRDDDRVKKETQDAPKRPYAKPTLIEYGSVAKLTQSGGSTRFETAPMSRAGTCL